jgi:transposase
VRAALEIWETFLIAFSALLPLINPIGFHLTEGQACELDRADVLLPLLEAQTVIADKGFDADKRVLEPLQRAGKQAVIPPRANRKVQREYDKDLYKARHLIENFCAKLKLFRCIATRYDKTAKNFSPPYISRQLLYG